MTERKINLHLKGGTYEASAVGHGGSLTVESKFENNKIKAVKVVKQPYHKQKNYDSKDLATNLLVVGAGIAGLSTAAFALKNGLKR